MAIVRTDVLLAHSPLNEGDTVDVSCPSGQRMVVTNIDVAAGASAFTPLLGFEDLVSGGTWFVALTNGVLLASVTWQGRQAFNFGGGFRCNAHIANWDIRVTGWLLELP